MSIIKQKIIPTIRQMKDLESALKTDYEYLVLMNIHVGLAKSIVSHAKREGKKILLHADLIDGLKADEYGAEYIIQEIKPAGIISTRNNVHFIL